MNLKMKEEHDSSVLPKTPEEFLGSKCEDFERALEDVKTWASIPMLNYTALHKLKDCSLVRFRGMIQDMQDPEIYLEKYEVRNSENAYSVRIQEGKYRDILKLNLGEEVDYEGGNHQHGERRTLFVVSIPAVNEWCMEYEKSCNQDNIPEIIPIEEYARDTMKRSASDERADTVSTSNLNTNTEFNKRQKAGDRVEKTACSTLNAEYLLNSPVPGRPSKACMIKIYKDFDAFTLNTIVDVVGFLSIDPRLDATAMEIDFENESELQAQYPPPSLIPRLHAIKIHKLSHANPLLDTRFLSSKTSMPRDCPNFKINSIQKDLHTLLKLCLFNDELAADYVLSHLISTVYSRCDLQTIGKLSINIWNLPKQVLKDYVKQFYEILELIIPASHYLPMSLEVMNEVNFVPRKDYDTNKLVSGLLQLAPHTHLILDETKMQEGKLESNGIKGVQSIADVINNQQIKYNFLYYEIEYNVDIPVLVFSEGRSMLPNDISLPLEADVESVKMIDEVMKAARHYLHQHSRLDQFRRYLTISKLSEFTMNPTDEGMIQDDFVTMRKMNSVTTADDLHNLLIVSRLLAIARGKKVLDRESWELAKTMEEQRKHRITKLPKSKVCLR